MGKLDCEINKISNITKTTTLNYDFIVTLDLRKFHKIGMTSLSKGVLSKWFVSIDKINYMIKTSSINSLGDFNNESVVESIVYNLCKAWRIDCATYIPVRIIYVDDVLGDVECIGVATRWFVKEAEVLLSHKTIKHKLKFRSDTDDFINYTDIIPQVVPQLRRMILIDYIIQNHDRHGENFGVIFDGKYRPAPLYDNGAGLFGLEHIGDSSKYIDNFYGKGFKTGRNGTKDALIYLEGFSEDLPNYSTISNMKIVNDILDGYKSIVDNQRLNSMYKLIEGRIKDVRYLYY